MHLIPTLTTLAPLVILALGTLIMLIHGAATNNARGNAWLAALTFATAATPWLLHPRVANLFPTGSIPSATARAGGPALEHATEYLLRLSPYSLLASLLILGLAILAIPLAGSWLAAHKANKPEYPVLLVLAVTGMLILINSADFLSFYMGLELMSFPLYILTAFLRNDARSSEAALKYFVLGGLATGLFLYGVSLLYAATGTTGFYGLHAMLSAPDLSHNPLVLTGMALVLTGTLFKLSAAPLHMWTPDVYDGAPTPVTAFMGSLPKVAAGVVLLRLLWVPFAAQMPAWQPIIAVMALLSMGLGAVLAILQTNLKRLLAWSTVANVGFILVGVVAPSTAGASAVLVYLVIYALTTLALFSVLLATGIETTTQLKGFGQRQPLLAVAFGVMLFSLAGIPPFAGFMAKFAVFSAAVSAGFSWLALAAVLASGVTAFYSLWLVKLIAFDAPADTTSIPLANANLAPLAILLAAALVLLGLFPSLLTNLTLPAATGLF